MNSSLKSRIDRLETAVSEYQAPELFSRAWHRAVKRGDIVVCLDTEIVGAGWRPGAGDIALGDGVWLCEKS